MNLKQNEKELYMAACKASEFIKKHYPSAREWDDPVGWCAWYVSNGFMVALHEPETGKILALVAARPVNSPEDGNIPYKHVENGSCIFIDLLLIEEGDPLIIPAFAMECRQRFGDRKQVAWTRVATHDYENFLRNAGRITNIGRPNYVATIPA